MLSLRHLLASCAILLPAAAFAASQDINLTAVVPDTCTISSSDNPTAVSHALSIDAAGKVVTTPVTFSFPILCNSPAVLSLTAVNSGLTGPAAKANFDHYRATAKLGAAASVLATDVAAESIATLPPMTGTMSVDVSLIAKGKPLVAGTYSSVLNVVLEPAN